MKKLFAASLSVIILLVIFLSFMIVGHAAETTVTFNGLGYSHEEEIPLNTNIGGFVFDNGNGLGVLFYGGQGQDSTDCISPNDGPDGDPKVVNVFTIKRADNSSFKLVSMYLDDDDGYGSQYYSIDGYFNNAKVDAYHLDVDAFIANTHTFNWDCVDEVRITAKSQDDYYNAYNVQALIDNIVYDDAVAPNTAPSISTNNGLTLSEGATSSLQTHLVATDNEQSDPTLVYTVIDLPNNGVITKDGAVLTLNGTFTQAQIGAGNISYVHDGTDTTSDSFTFKVSDGAGEEVTGQTFYITITPVNDNPTISWLPTDVSVVEDTLSNVDLSAAILTDDSGSAPITLYIQANTGTVMATSGGGVTVSGSGTQTITLSGTVSNIDTYLNTASNIKFIGAPNAYGSNAATLTLTANDGGNTGTGGGTDVALGSVNMDIAAVNDPPYVINNLGLGLNEGASKTITTTALSAGDVETADSLLSFTLTSGPSNGHLENTDNPSVSITSFTQQNLTDGKILYVHNGSNTISDSFTFKVADDEGGELTGQTFSITINAIDDDAPTISKNDCLTLDEGATKSLETLLVATDTEQNDDALIYTVTDLSDNGSLKNNGATLTLNGSFTQAQLDAGSVTYTHDGTNTTSDSFTFKVSDGPNELTNQTFNITVNAVDDDAPTISKNDGLTLDEGQTKSLRALLIATDTEQNDASLTYTVTSLPSNGSLTMATFSQAQLDAGNVKYTHDGTNTTSDSFTFKVSDGPNELTGQTFNITVNAVDDDAPTISKNDGITLDEGAAKSLKALLIATDTEQNDATLTYTVTSLPSNGSLTMATFSQAQLDAGNVKYTHDGTNTTSDSFTFKVSDGPNELTGQTFNITVNAVDDDAPTISKNDGITLDEGAAKSLKALLIATDTEQNDATLTYTVTSLPSNGSLTMATFSQAQLDAGNVKYAHDGTNTTSDSFTFKVSDGANELAGQTFSITINPVDDPPAPTPEPTPEPTPTPNPTEQRVTVTGTLLDDDGKPLAGYTVELHSTPRTTVTDSKGRYTFTDVEVADHSLIVKENDGSTLKSFAITVKTGEDFAWSKPDDDSITAVVQDDTASIDVTIKIADDGTVTVNNIENIVNPQTGDVQQSSVWALVIVGALIISTMLIMKRKQLN